MDIDLAKMVWAIATAGSASGVFTEEFDKEKCKTCKYMINETGGYCYMFREQPTEKCNCFKED